jgi:hypothetical protein
MVKGNPMKGAVVAIVMFIISLLSYSPLAIEIDTYANNATVTNAVWVLLDTIFPIFWALFCILWLGVAVSLVIKVR